MIGFPGEEPGLVMLVLHLRLPLVVSLAFFPSIVTQSQTRLKLTTISVTINIIDISIKIIIITIIDISITIVTSTYTIALANLRAVMKHERKAHLESFALKSANL